MTLEGNTCVYMQAIAILKYIFRLKSAKDSVVFVLDDNMPLRSMRHEYYKVARKCKLKDSVQELIIYIYIYIYIYIS